MTAPELDVVAVQARLDAALALTPEPWEVGAGWVYTLPIHDDDNRLANVLGVKYTDPDRAEAERERVQRNAELIAHAPTDLRLLLEALKEARDRYDVLDQHAHSQGGLTDQIVDAEARATAAEAALVAERAKVERVRAVCDKPDDVQWWPVQPYMDPPDDDEVTEVRVLSVDRVLAALGTDAGDEQ